MDWIETLRLNDLCQSLLSLLALWVTAYLVPRLRAYIEKKIEEQNFGIMNSYLLEFNDIVAQTVSMTTQSFVDQVKAKSADGKLTKEEMEEAYRLTSERIKSSMSAEMTKMVKRGRGDVDEYIHTLVEATIANSKPWPAQEKISGI